jgi:small subunit ribosomal protein S2
MPKVELTQLIEAGAHFGHLTRRWNPKMKKYIFMERKGIHIIDLKKTQKAIDHSFDNMVNVASEGKKILFVGTKTQAKGIIKEQAERSGSNYVTERWLGGMLTNFATIRKSIKRLQNIEKMETDGTFEKITKKERLQLTREKDKLRTTLGGIETLNRLPGAIFIVDIKKESIAVNEALKLNIPIFAIVDTNCDPDPVDYLIPSNDDAVRSIELITKTISDAVIEGQSKAQELKAEKAAAKEREKKEKEEEVSEEDKSKRKVKRVRFDEKGKKTEEKEVKSEQKAEKQKEEAKKAEESEKKSEKTEDKSGEETDSKESDKKE